MARLTFIPKEKAAIKSIVESTSKLLKKIQKKKCIPMLMEALHFLPKELATYQQYQKILQCVTLLTTLIFMIFFRTTRGISSFTTKQKVNYSLQISLRCFRYRIW